MTLASGLLVYALIWTVVLFAVLPWGVRVPENPEAGHASSAPDNPRLWLKALITSAISLLLWLLVYWFMQSGLVTLRPID